MSRLRAGTGAFRQADAGPHGAVDLLRRRHAVADGAAFGRGHSARHRRQLARRQRRRDHARGQPDLGRGRAVSRLSRGGGQPRVARRAVAARRSRWPNSAAATPSTRRSPRCGWRSRSSRARSFDLIYARPKQTLEDWQDELTEALWLARGHISLYQLTIEQGTRYFDLFLAGKLKLPDEDLAADFFELTQELTKEAGLPAYEISNHARPGQESQPQPALLALRRICRRRPRRARPAAAQQPPPRHRDGEDAVRLAEARASRAATAWSPTTC